MIILCNFLILFAAVFCAFGADVNKTSEQTQVTLQQARVLSISQNVYSYNPLGKPDPFKPLVEAKVATPVKKELKPIKTKVESIFPLQKVETESFNLVGIIGDQTRRVAIVEDSAKKFYPLVVGTRIGLRNGKVSEILSDRITVDELAGKKVKRIVLKLRNN